MNNQTNAQIYALVRVMEILEEGSIDNLVQHDMQFKSFITQVYGELQDKAVQLQSQRFSAV